MYYNTASGIKFLRKKMTVRLGKGILWKVYHKQNVEVKK